MLSIACLLVGAWLVFNLRFVLRLRRLFICLLTGLCLIVGFGVWRCCGLLLVYLLD